jgi:environmental stress-induced protein Ves
MAPAGANDDDFIWRASIATIAADGPFSHWPGIDRALMVLRGKLKLKIGASSEQEIATAGPAIFFCGEEVVVARPESGPCIVLNLMARRGFINMRLERWIAPRLSTTGYLFLFAEQPTKVCIEETVIDLPAYDALLLSGAAAESLVFDLPLVIAELCSQGHDERLVNLQLLKRTGR